MRLTTALFQKLYNPPNVVLSVSDHCVSQVDLTTDQPPFVALVLQLHHPELSKPYRQMFKLPPLIADALGRELIAHAGVEPEADEPDL